MLVRACICCHVRLENMTEVKMNEVLTNNRLAYTCVCTNIVVPMSGIPPTTDAIL